MSTPEEIREAAERWENCGRGDGSFIEEVENTLITLADAYCDEHPVDTDSGYTSVREMMCVFACQRVADEMKCFCDDDPDAPACPVCECVEAIKTGQVTEGDA